MAAAGRTPRARRAPIDAAKREILEARARDLDALWREFVIGLQASGRPGHPQPRQIFADAVRHDADIRGCTPVHDLGYAAAAAQLDGKPPEAIALFGVMFISWALGLGPDDTRSFEELLQLDVREDAEADAAKLLAASTRSPAHFAGVVTETMQAVVAQLFLIGRARRAQLARSA